VGTFNYPHARVVDEESMSRKGAETAPEDEVTVVPKRIGGSLAVFLPADFVRRLGLYAGQPIRIAVRAKGRHPALGILKGLVPDEPFDRHAEGFEPDE
jgi:hypothetical protein